MKARIVRVITGLAIALTVICLGAWIFLLIAMIQNPNVHPFFLKGLSQWPGQSLGQPLGQSLGSRLPTLLVVAMFWLMPVWISYFGLRIRNHWRTGHSGLLPALLMNASSVPVLAAVAVYLAFSDT
jgi:hypothetical protein